MAVQVQELLRLVTADWNPSRLDEFGTEKAERKVAKRHCSHFETVEVIRNLPTQPEVLWLKC
jgi:hypothetical protein